jgi:peptidoglycan/LPS O-acetylase OafA/YrhL
MRRRWNWLVWTGFAVALLAALSYIPVFVPFPVTRDFPWANLLLFLCAGCLLAVGLHRAFRRGTEYRGKISGVILGALSFALFALFCLGTFYFSRKIPNGEAALHTGRPAPDFSLAATDGKPVALSQLRQGKRAVLLIFYRGYW